jgi:tRNA pseudouridine38-40 synthase
MEDRLDLERMRAAAQLLIGPHDFSAFCANKKMKKSTVRTIKSFDIEQVADEIRFTVTGNGFLHNMVRILVGTLIEVGRGERTAESIPALFGAKREDAGFLAPGKGLCLPI